MRYKSFNFRKLCPEIRSTTYSTHGLHSYTAKFIPQIPRYFIKKYCETRDTVLDPFCGSGTTLLEANILDSNAIGTDINPLARLIAKVKTTPIDPELIKISDENLKKKLMKRVKLNYNVDFPNKNYWFHKSAIYQLRKIFSVVHYMHMKDVINKDLLDYYLVCASSIIRKSSYADLENPKTYCSPRMKAKREEGISTQPIKLFLGTIKNNYLRMKDLALTLNGNESRSIFLSSNDATELNTEEKVDLIVTSPPYANAQEYFRNIKLELYWLKLADKELISKLDKQQIGGENHASQNFDQIHLTNIPVIDTVIKKIHKKDKRKAYVIYKYFYNMDKNVFECSRVLKKGKHLVFIVGNNYVKGHEIPIHKGIVEISKNHGFELSEMGYDNIRYRKFMTKRNNNANPIKKDWVIDLIKS